MKITLQVKSGLGRYKKILETANKHGYIRQIPRKDLNTMLDYYEKITGVAYKEKLNCNTCVFQFINILSKYYYEAEVVYPKDEVKEDKPEDIRIEAETEIIRDEDLMIVTETEQKPEIKIKTTKNGTSKEKTSSKEKDNN